MIFGRGEQPLVFVSAADVADVADVAAVASRAVTDATLRGKILEVAGEPVTMTDLARALQTARGWQGSPRHLPRPVLRTLATLTRPVNPAFARANRTALTMDTAAPGPRVDTASLLGRAPQTVADVLARLDPS